MCWVADSINCPRRPDHPNEQKAPDAMAGRTLRCAHRMGKQIATIVRYMMHLLLVWYAEAGSAKTLEQLLFYIWCPSVAAAPDDDRLALSNRKEGVRRRMRCPLSPVIEVCRESSAENQISASTILTQ